MHDFSEVSPVGDEKQFAELVEGMVADFAPRIFAIVQEYGERADGRIVAWGMEFEDHVQVVNPAGGVHMTTTSTETALRGFHRGTHIRPRLVWVNPDAATPPDDQA